MVEVVFSKTVEKSFLRLKSSDKLKVSKAIDKLEENPLIGKKLEGKFKGFFVLRAWPYRIIYQFLPKQRLIEIVIIEHRQRVYR